MALADNIRVTIPDPEGDGIPCPIYEGPVDQAVERLDYGSYEAYADEGEHIHEGVVFVTVFESTFACHERCHDTHPAAVA